MKKYFMFAALATAGLFAGCSSDDTLSLSEGNFAPVNDNEKAAIQLFIGNAGSTVTRGTGTVGGVVGSKENKWGGQKFNLMMLNKDLLTYAVDGEGQEIYKNTEFTTPNVVGGVDENTPAIEVTGSTEDGGIQANVKYFPQDGAFDFWAYRLDGAEKGDPQPEDEKLAIDFEIDGSQDIMVAKAEPTAEKVEGGYKGKSGDKEVTVADDRVFSAYSVRRGVNPKLSFEHLLTRLTFTVKASDGLSGTKDGDNSTAISVTGITLKAKNTGKLYVAWTPGNEPENRIDWNEETGDLTLMQRAYAYNVLADVEFISASGKEFNTTISSKKGGDPIYFTKNTIVYPTDDVNPKTGLPINGKTAEEAESEGNLGSYYLAFIITPPSDPTFDVSANLEPLEAVVPMKEDVADGGKGTSVGEALLVAPQDSYTMTIETLQKVITKAVYYDCLVATEEEIDGETWYFNNEENAAAAVAASKSGDEAAKKAALAKGSTTQGARVLDMEQSEYEPKSNSAELTLYATSTTTGSTTTHDPFEANKTYNIVITLAGQEPVFGDKEGNVDIGGYVEGGDDIEVDMDE